MFEVLENETFQNVLWWGLIILIPLIKLILAVGITEFVFNKKGN